MLFNLSIIVIVGVIALWHYTQGFFSAALSAFLSIMSALLAFSLMESVVNLIKPASFADSADAIVFCALFVLIHLGLRFAFDRLVPGNVALHFLADKIGALVMGGVAGMVSAGVIAVAAQMMGVGPEIGGYSRYAVIDQREMNLHVSGSRDITAVIYNAMESASFSGVKPQTLLLDVDDALMGMVGRLSANALCGAGPLARAHPDYLQELFGQRLGLEAGAKHAAPNYPGQEPQIKVTGLYRLDSVEQRDDLDPALRPENTMFEAILRKPEAGQLLLVVRTMIDPKAKDADDLFRFSTGNCRLVCRSRDGADKGAYKNYYPIGTLEAGTRLYANRLDDPMFVDMASGPRGVDLVFLIDNAADIVAPAEGSGTAEKMQINFGTLLEFKRMGYVDLSSDESGNQAVLQGAPPLDPLVKVMRQTVVQPVELAIAINPRVAAEAPLQILRASASDRLFRALSVPTLVDNGKFPDRQHKTKNFEGNLQERKFVDFIAHMELTDQNPVDSTSVDQLLVPFNKQIMQFECQANAANHWAWTSELPHFELVDETGHAYRPAGAWCVVTRSSGGQMFVGRYTGNPNAATFRAEDGNPERIWLAFVYPKDAVMAVLRYNDKPIWAVHAAR